jgi:hypothetical protein
LFKVSFGVTLDLESGKSLAVLGSVSELGEWSKKGVVHHMMWTKGNKWISRIPMDTSTRLFRYKYVIMENKGTTFVEFEKGIDHIADLDLAETDEDGTIYFNDTWEIYHLRFTVFSHEGDEQMVIDFKHANEGKIETMEMKRADRNDKWLWSKYGIDVVPWECFINMPNTSNNATGGFED